MMKTSSRIALQFASWIAILVGALFIFLNLFFFWGWVNGDAENLRNNMASSPSTGTINQDMLSNDIIYFRSKGPNAFDPTKYPHYFTIHRIRHISGRWRMIGIDNGNYRGLEVTQNIERQRGLMIMSGILWLIVTGGSYILGTMFVRRSLRDLLALKKKLDSRSAENPEGSLYVPHLPKDDEINRIAHAIMKLENRVQRHYDQLRNFVGHASHELKTPLMEMRSDLDLINRTHAFEKLPPKVASHIDRMQKIIDTMFLLTRIEEKTTIETTKISIKSIINDIIASLQNIHIHHNSFVIDAENDIVCDGHEELIRSLFYNIIENACKYSLDNTPIYVTMHKRTVTIKNEGTLSDNALENMREPFRQEDKNRTDGMGIGLSLTKQITTLHKWSVSYHQDGSYVVATIDIT